MTLDQIIAAVAAHYGVTIADIKSQSRKQCVSKPRQVIMYLARTHTDLSLPYIGNRLGGKHHTTVLHGARNIEWLLDGDPKLASDVLAIEAELGV